MSNFFRVTGIVLGLLILVSCSKRNQEEGSWSHFLGLVDTVTVRDTILKVDTLIVDREVVLRDTVLFEKEVIKKVEVPAEIPEEYKRAFEKFRSEYYATTASDVTIFSNIDELRVVVFLNDGAEKIISEQRVRDKFELLLRRYGIPLTPFRSSSYIYFSVNVVNRDNKNAAHTIELSLEEEVIFYRGDKPYRKTVTLWNGGGNFGYVCNGNIWTHVEDAILEQTERSAERVANLYLSANPR